MQDAQCKKKIMKAFRLTPKVVKAIKKAAQERKCDETWIVETILSIALGVSDPPKPLPNPELLKSSLPAEI
jgi:hypothetical protein